MARPDIPVVSGNRFADRTTFVSTGTLLRPLFTLESRVYCPACLRRVHVLPAKLQLRRTVKRVPQCNSSIPNPEDDSEVNTSDDANKPVDTTRVLEDQAFDTDSGAAVMVKPDLRLASAFVFLGGFFIYIGDKWLGLGYPMLICGFYLFFVTYRVRFFFGPTKLNLAFREGGHLEFFRGWAYDRITVWDVYPSLSLPMLAYFRETESFQGKGTFHFFPIVIDGKQFVSLIREKTGRSRGL